ncbi:MAG: hypothetical protein HC905_04510 [Bacteroidales bacterium]|nr:hypothetical protein [Bacteroidales bacterium]
MNVDINLKDMNFYVLPVSIQMLVENAIKHNEISQEFPLKVEITDNEEYLIVSNPVQPKMLETPSKGIGLQNLKVRYKFFTDKEIIIESDMSKFNIKIPKLKV